MSEGARPIRVLQVSYDMSRGGAETLVMSLYRNMDRTRVQFDFLLHNPARSAYEDEIESLGGRIYRIPRFLGYNKISYDRDLRAFLTEHPEHRIVHVHLMDSASETLRVAKSLGRVAVSHSHTADVPFSAGELVRRWFRKDLWKIADHRFACSQAAGRWLYRGKADFTVLNNGIDTKSFRFDPSIREARRRELGVDGSSPLVGTVGRMEDYKNHLRLLEMFRKAADRDPRARLAIVGFGSMEAQIRDRVKDLGLSGKVILTGPRGDVNELLMAFDAFVLPSVYEGLGIALVEAQASGLPCIYTDTIPTDVDLIPSLLQRTSLSESDDLWAERMLGACSMARDRETCHSLVAAKGYDIETSAKVLQDLYLKWR